MGVQYYAAGLFCAAGNKDGGAAAYAVLVILPSSVRRSLLFPKNFMKIQPPNPDLLPKAERLQITTNTKEIQAGGGYFR